MLCMLSVGKMYVLGEYMSAYRFVLDSDSGSWSSKNDLYATENLINYLDGLKFMEKIATALSLPLDFDDKRTFELEKLYLKRNEFSKADFIRIKRIIKKGYNSHKKYMRAYLKICF